MDPREGLRIAVRALVGHRLRSALTIVGIVIGIATVIAFASFGASVQSDVVSEFQGTSASEIYLLTGSTEAPDDGPPVPGAGAEFALPAITTADIESLKAIDGVRTVIPRGEIPVVSLRYGNETIGQDSVTATTTAAFTGGTFVAGEAFESGPADPTTTAGDIVLSQTAANRFEQNVSVGGPVTIDFGGRQRNFTVVGIVTDTRGGIGDFGDLAPEVYIPADPFYTATASSPTQGVDQRAYRQVTVVAEAGNVPTVQSAIEAYFDSNEADAPQILGADGTVTVQSTADIVEGIQSVLEDITRLVTGIGVLALLVGAFGIANIMLVSVTERTREIGIMKAVGARNREVMSLFLAEAVLLGLAGAVIGIPVGLGVGYGAAIYADVSFTIPVGWIGLATGMGLVIGAVAGLYPAWRAARVDPIEALRYE